LIFAGLLFGYAILTKDIFAIMTIAPVFLAGLWRTTLPWRAVAIVCSSAVVPYAIYLLLVSTDSLIGLWFRAKESGLERMVGLQQTTGFNDPHSPSLVSRLTGEIFQFGTSYILLALCPVVGVIAARSQHSFRRLIGLCALTMGAFGIYTALFGTFEEQYGYGVMIASVLGIGAAYPEVRERWPGRAVALRVCGVTLILLTITLGIRAEVTPDDGVLQVRSWVQVHLPANARVGVTTSTSQWAFANDPRFGVWPSARSMWQHQADYILTQSLLTNEGYGYARKSMLQWLQGHAQAVFEFTGPTNGQTVLWYVDPSLLSQAAKAGVGS
jgi:hypothetical protein